MHRKIGFISPNNSGLFLRNCERQTSSIAGDKATPRDYNCVEIHGAPVEIGTIKVTIGGSYIPKYAYSIKRV